MLESGETSLAVVAMTCGYSSQAHMTSAFRRHVGTTPGRYRDERLPITVHAPLSSMFDSTNRSGFNFNTWKSPHQWCSWLPSALPVIESTHNMASGYATVREPGFSNAALVGFFARSLAAQDAVLLPSDFKLADLRDTRKSIAHEKRRLADHALEVGGPGPLLAVGRMLGAVRDHPNIAVLLSTINPEILAWRWMRLEHAHKSPHLVDIQNEGDSCWDCRHTARETMPSPAESMLVSGVLAGLLDQIGATDVVISVGKDRILSDALVAGAAADATSFHRFRIAWSGIGKAAGQDGELLSTTDVSSIEDQLLAMLRKDPARAWRLADVADHFALSTRSLQRRLNDAGYSFDTLVREARVAESAQWLRRTDNTLEFIAQSAGFADQPHFQREFVRVLDVTPAIYREIAKS